MQHPIENFTIQNSEKIMLVAVLQFFNFGLIICVYWLQQYFKQLMNAIRFNEVSN